MKKPYKEPASLPIRTAACVALIITGIVMGAGTNKIHKHHTDLPDKEIMSALPKYNGKNMTLALKTNTIYAALTKTPNIALEIGIAPKASLDIKAAYNPWNLNGSEQNNRKLAHWIVSPEYRYWLCERFNGHFLGIHTLVAQYNIAGHKIPLLLDKDAKEHRYEGIMAGAGISYGYHIMIAKKWNIELNAGYGYAIMKYDKFRCEWCGDKISEDNRKNYLGPTRAGISLVYLIK